MEWTDAEVLKLIDAYRNESVLWDPQHSDHKNFNFKNMAWDSLAVMFSRDQTEIRKKVHSLLASYRREYNKVGTRIASRKGVRIYKSSWFAYESLRFLHYKSKKQRKVLEVCSIHFIDGHPTNRNPNPALKLGYERKIKVEDYNDDDGEEDCKDGILNQVPQDDEAQAITIVPMRKAPPMKTRSRTVPLTNETPYGTVMNTVVPLRDEYATYGEHVANKLRKLEDHDRAIAQHKINNILFEAEMGRYRNVLS